MPASVQAVQAGRKCSISGCDAWTKPNYLMCLAHWRRVPRAVARNCWGRTPEASEARVEAIRFVNALEAEGE